MIEAARIKIKLSDNWKWARCGEVIDVRDGTHDTPKYVTSGYPLITSKNLKTEGIDFSNVSYISKEDHYEISKRSRVDRGDILFAMIGTIGNPVIVDVDSEFSIKNVALFKFSKSPIDAKYFKYLLETPIITEQLNSEQRGGTQKFVSLNVLRNIVIPYPPIEEQHRIAAILDKADAVRRKRQSAIALTEELWRSAFLEMFGDPVTNSKGWEFFELQAVTECIVDCPHSTPDWTDNGIICLRTSNLTEGGWNWDDTRYVTEEDYRNRTSRAEIFSGDIILSREGTVGIAAIVPDEFQVCMGQRLVQVRPEQRLIKPSYLLRLLLWQLAPERIGKLMRGSTSQHLNVKDLRSMSIPVASLELQEQFSKLARQIDALKEKMIKSESEQEKNFNSLLQRAFRGEL